MGNISFWLEMIAEIIALLGVVFGVFTVIKRLLNGMRCQLRSEMLRTYYDNHEEGKIRQYEYENFVMLYEAYKALKGNSFIDKIYEDVKSWEIIS